MSKGNLLNEGTIRRFMKLAGTQVLASDFLAEGGKAGQQDRKDVANIVPEKGQLKEEELEEGDVVTEQEEELEAGAEELDMGLDLEPAPEDEEPAEEEATSVEGFARDVLDAIKDVATEHGVDMEVEEMEPEELDVGELEPAGAEETGELDALPAEEEGPEELAEINYIDDDALLQEVYGRVSSRLLREKKADELASALAERVSRKLNKR